MQYKSLIGFISETEIWTYYSFFALVIHIMHIPPKFFKSKGID